MDKLLWMLKTVFKELTTADAYRNDWFGWGRNQLVHTFIGLGLVGVLCYALFKHSGEFPYKTQVFWLIAIVYAAKELRLDGWNGWDTIEDFIFVVLYGAGGTLLSFSEKEPGTAKVVFDLDKSAPVAMLCCAHLICGVVWRLWGKFNERRTG